MENQHSTGWFYFCWTRYRIIKLMGQMQISNLYIYLSKRSLDVAWARIYEAPSGNQTHYSVGIDLVRQPCYSLHKVDVLEYLLCIRHFNPIMLKAICRIWAMSFTIIFNLYKAQDIKARIEFYKLNITVTSKAITPLKRKDRLEIK